MTSCIRFFIPLIMAMCLFGTSMAADNKTVEVKGETVFYDDGSHSRIECMRLAAEQARIDALASKFGTTVSQNLLQTDRISSGREHNDFLSLSSSEVRGEWVADIAEPEYEFSTDENHNLVVVCRVKGYAKPISNESAEFEALALRNGALRGNAETRFVDNDDLRLLFSSPADGYVAVYLEDESRSVYELLPYPEDNKSFLKVRRGKEYIFFDMKLADPDCGPAREIYLTAPDALEYNRIYVVFSPEPFSRPASAKAPGEMGVISSKDFNRWLAKARRNDPKMGVKSINIQISPERF